MVTRCVPNEIKMRDLQLYFALLQYHSKKQTPQNKGNYQLIYIFYSHSFKLDAKHVRDTS